MRLYRLVLDLEFMNYFQNPSSYKRALMFLPGNETSAAWSHNFEFPSIDITSMDLNTKYNC